MFTLFLSNYLLLYLFFFIPISRAVLVNVTVDDSLPDPLTGQLITYLPTSAWKDGVACTDCSAAVNGQKMNDRTWHDGTYFPANSNLPPTGPLNASFKFTGTAIYVFCAIALSISNPTGYSNMTFYIDGELVGQFQKTPPGIQDYDYNVTVYSNTSMPLGEHEFMLQNGQFGNAGNKSLTLFDYLIYSYDDGSSPTTSSGLAGSSSSSASAASSTSGSSKSVGPIVGGVVGGIAGLAVVALAIWFLLRRKNTVYIKSKKPSSFTMGPATPTEPFVVPTRPPQQLMRDTNSHATPASSASVYPATSSTSGSVALGYGVGTGKHSRPPGPQGHYTSSSTSSGAVVGFNSVTSLAPRRELDAGPAIAEDENDEEETLPPEYGQVFAQSSSRQVSDDVPERRNIAEKGRPNRTLVLNL